MTKHLWLQLENELQWAKVWTRAVREHLELFCQQVWSLTGSGRVQERPWGSLSLCVLSLMGLCGPRASAETFTQACCSRVLSPWKGQVGLVLSLFMRQMIDTSWAQAPALCFLPWVVSLSPAEWSSVFMPVRQPVWPVWPLHLDVSQTSPGSQVLTAPSVSLFPTVLCCLLTFSLLTFVSLTFVFGVIHTCWMSGGNSTCNFRHK